MTTRRNRPVLLALILSVAPCAITSAGPPLICHPVEIGQAECLPWGDDGFSRSRGYRSDALVGDTLRVLEGQPSALVHMETLRRATLYVDRDRELALRLIGGFMARALDAEARERPDPLAWFDAGYLAQCFEQNGLRLGVDCGTGRGVVGYAWVRRALALRGDDPELQFGAAMVTVLSGIDEHDEHVARVRALAPEGSLVERNLRTHSTTYWAGHGRRQRA
jgi:hypothetical protein